MIIIIIIQRFTMRSAIFYYLPNINRLFWVKTPISFKKLELSLLFKYCFFFNQILEQWFKYYLIIPKLPIKCLLCFFLFLFSRCYNCGEFANHIAAKCTMGPQPKRCHNCKSEDHLIADCPQRKDKSPPGGGSEQEGSLGEGTSSGGAFEPDNSSRPDEPPSTK